MFGLISFVTFVALRSLARFRSLVQRSEMSDTVAAPENQVRTCSIQCVSQQQHKELESFVNMTMSQEMDHE